MSILSKEARDRLDVATASSLVGDEISDALDAALEGKRANGGTYKALTLFVSATDGKDSNPGTETAPFKTIQAAVGSLPKVIRHPVVVRVLPGTYAGGAYIHGFLFDPADPQVGAYLIVRGTMDLATGLTSGTASGTITSRSSGSASTTAWGSMSDSTQSWTTNELRGKFVQFLTGAANDFIRPIVSNTGDTIVVPGSLSTAAAVGVQYRIIEPTAIINDGLRYPPSALNASSFTGTNQNAFWVTGAPGQLGSGNISIERFAFQMGANGSALHVRGPAGCTFQWNACTGNWSTDAIWTSGGSAGIAANYNIWAPGSGSGAPSFVWTNSPAEISLFGNIVDFMDVDSYFLTCGGARLTLTANSVQSKDAVNHITTMRITPAPGSMFTGNKFVGQGTGSKAFICIQTVSGFSSLHGAGGGAMTLSGNEFNNYQTAVQAYGGTVITVGSGGFSNNDLAIVAQEGGRAKVASGVTFTSNTNDLSVDGTTSTIAAMRAVTGPPAKSLSNSSTFSRIWE